MIIKLNKLAIAEIDEESIMLKQFYDNRNGNAVMVKFELNRFYDKFEAALLFVRVTSTESKSSREKIAGSRIRLRKGENFPLYYVSSIDAAKDLFLIFEIQSTNFGEYSQFGSLKVYPKNKNEKLVYTDQTIDVSRLNLEKYRSSPQKTNGPFGMKSSMVERFNVGSRGRQQTFSTGETIDPAQADRLKRQMGLTDEMLIQRLGLTDDALKMRLGLTEELMQSFINNAVMLVRDNLGITDDILNILSFNTQQYSMDIQRLKATIDTFKNNANQLKTTIDKMDIPGLEKNYSYVEKRYDWAKLRCEQLERKFSNQIDEFSEELKDKSEALDQLLQEFLDWTDEKRQVIQDELDKILEFQYKSSEAIQLIENTKTSCTHMRMVDPFERARAAACRLYEILNQDKVITSQSIKQNFPKDLQERMQILIQIENHLSRLIPLDMSEQNASWIAEHIQAVKDKFIWIRDRYAFYPSVLSESAEGFIQKIENISYQDIEAETRLKEEKQLHTGPWKSMDPLQIYQERVDLHLEQLRKTYHEEKSAALPQVFTSEKTLSKALDQFVIEDLFVFIQKQLPEIEEKYAQMVSTEKPVEPFFNDIRKNLMSIANIQKIKVEPDVDLFDPELHNLQKTVHRPDMQNKVVLETISTGYRLGAIGPVLEKTTVVINDIEG
ncbi:MAG: nucleotide exchange factor GrpE [Candidatus Magnetomorum sp.]|nr:nucleotide exchange factor GrpE [Candidatus Magnetomorum sp.]